MANHEHTQERCPSCGRNEIKADRRYGNKLRRNAFLKRAVGSFLAWIFALILLEPWRDPWRDPTVFSVLALLGFALALVVIVRTYRQVYGASSAGRYPDARYTCRLCGHCWTPDESPAAVVNEIDEMEATGEIAPQETETDLRAVTPAASRARWNQVKTGRIIYYVLLTVGVVAVWLAIMADFVRSGQLEDLLLGLPVILFVSAVVVGIFLFAFGGRARKAGCVLFIVLLVVALIVEVFILAFVGLPT